MADAKRLSICYAAPGSSLVPSAGTTRNVLNLADALSEWADVTVAFRTIQDQSPSDTYRVVALDPEIDAGPGRPIKDDNAARGLHPLGHLAYCRTLWRFASDHANAYDIVLEKGWRLSGWLSTAFRRRGVPAVLVENDVRMWTDPVIGPTSAAKYGLHLLAQTVSGVCCRRLPAVIAETEELKSLLVEVRGLTPRQVEVVGLGVDHRLFRPLDQARAREAQGIRLDSVILLYVGAMDEYHDLEPAIEALGRVHPHRLELHVIGEGEFRGRCEAKARAAGVTARFHGHVPHARVPEYIATADLCLAPYRTSAFWDGRVTFSTLKIPEYMACAKPVVSVPSGSILKLIEPGATGFVFDNHVDAWVSLLSAMPSRTQLASMGHAAAAAVALVSWRTTASRYLDVCTSQMAAHAAVVGLPQTEPHGR